MGLLFRDPDALVQASMLKGWFFVAVTTLLLFVLVRQLIGQLDASLQRERVEIEEKERTMQLLAAVAESSSDAIFAKDEHGRYLLINNAALVHGPAGLCTAGSGRLCGFSCRSGRFDHGHRPAGAGLRAC